MSSIFSKYEELIQKYHYLFPQEEDSQEPITLFGFECKDGWYNILAGLFQTITQDYRHHTRSLNYYTSKNDSERIKEYTELRDQALEKLPMFMQIKEKFGTLRIYYANGNKEIDRLTDFAEYMSEVTCEMCGNVGQTYTLGWHRTLCRDHAVSIYGENQVKFYEENSKDTQN